MATYGIVIRIPQLTLTLLANIETATKSDYGLEFCLAMHAIRKKYTYNHVHDATSLQTILTELAGANGVRTLKDAPAPNATTGCSVANSISFLNTMMHDGTTASKYASKYTKSAYGASSDSGSVEKRGKSRNKKKKSKSKSRKKKKKEKDKDDEPKKNTCPHCKKYHRNKSHRDEPEKMHVEQELQDMNDKENFPNKGPYKEPVCGFSWHTTRCLLIIAGSRFARRTLSLFVSLK
jgi:hypothetical protein